MILRFAFVFLLFYATASAQLPSFPGAEGYGAIASGGRGGRVIHVTTLEDDGNDVELMPGSLREAIRQQDPRIIVFDVGGTIDLQAPLFLGGGNFTLAGQTAPGGLTISGQALSDQRPTIAPRSNFIVRHVRLRGLHGPLDDPSGGDVMFLKQSTQFILDHVSFTGGYDETVNFWEETTDYTMQWCSIEESALWGQGGANHGEGDHNLGFLQGNCPNVRASLHHCLIANHDTRMPRFASAGPNGRIDLRNNVFYNWGSSASHLGILGHKLETGVAINVIGNSWIVGPAAVAIGPGAMARLIRSDGARFYPPGFAGNEWLKSGETPEPAIPPLIGAGTFVETPWAMPAVTSHTAAEARKMVLELAGAWPRDATTRRTVQEVRLRTGGMGLRGPYERFPERTGPQDQDRDGMPDIWETAHGLDPESAADGNDLVPPGRSQRHEGYTWLEFYLNELADNITGVSGPTHIIVAAALPADAGAVLCEHGVTWGDTIARGGYNAPYWYGKVEFGVAEYNHGSIVMLKAKAKPEHKFSHWSGGPADGSTALRVSFSATADAQVTAIFDEELPPDPPPDPLLIDDFDDRDYYSFWRSTDGSFKRWYAPKTAFVEIMPGNYALAATLPTNMLTLGVSGSAANVDQALAEFPSSAISIVMRVYNLGAERAVFLAGPEVRDPNHTMRWSFADWQTTLFYAEPFVFPAIDPGQSVVVSFPLTDLRSRNELYIAGVGTAFRQLRLNRFFSMWSQPVAIDDLTFGEQ